MPISSSQLADDVVPVFKRTTILTDAQIKALPSLSIEVVPAQGAGTIVIPVCAVLICTFIISGYAGIDEDGAEISIKWAGGSTVALTPFRDDVGAGVQDATNLLTVVGARLRWITLSQDAETPNYLRPSQINAIDATNRRLELAAINATGNFTGGNAANTIKATVLYVVIDV